MHPSIGTVRAVRGVYDNSIVESFFASLEYGLIARRIWKTKTELQLVIVTWIETCYNPRRCHSGLGQMSPINFEMKEQGTTIIDRELMFHAAPSRELRYFIWNSRLTLPTINPR